MVTAPVTTQPLDGFTKFRHADGGIEHDVYAIGPPDAPPIIATHEMPGLATQTCNFARRLSAAGAGFRVYLPHLFGELLAENTRKSAQANQRQLCVSQEFARLEAGVSAPITNWLRSLAVRLSAEHHDAPVGAIGMCATGSLAIPLVLERQVVAPVTSQPAVPFSELYAATGLGKGPWASQFNLADETLRDAAARLNRDNLTLLAFRFKPDRICAAEKIERLRHEFGDRLEAHEYDTPWWTPLQVPPPHAVLTYEYDKAEGAGPDHPTRQAFATLVEFFDRRLRPPSAPATATPGHD
jgi:dienelactone hydrolase